MHPNAPRRSNRLYEIRLLQADEACVFGSVMTGADRKTTHIVFSTFSSCPSILQAHSQQSTHRLMPAFSHQLEYKWPTEARPSPVRRQTVVAGYPSETQTVFTTKP